MEFPRISLEAARVNAKLTQREAAYLLGITPATLRNYEVGKTIPQWDTVKQMEKIYRMPADYIFFNCNLALSETNTAPNSV